ncbi:MAG: phospholipid carrier-dependent glycosyltransferase [Aphanocapsa feldmannii 288cV]|nr:MAG: phospholipid carrier-dependent glycosyltransferase [Aphanocapsa feldmannii 288cV]
MRSRRTGHPARTIDLPRLGLWVVTLLLGTGLFVWGLGSTGLVDETPPLFAAAGRAMVETGDWLTPRVNGNPRFDKPVLVYWLMGLGYAGIPASLDPFGSLAARLPSTLSAMAVMLGLADTFWCWQPQRPAPGSSLRRWCLALSAALAFALSPWVMVWARTAVSDMLLSALLCLALLGFWRHDVALSDNPGRAGRWPLAAWICLGLAVLTKGPVALALAALTCLLYGLREGRQGQLWQRLRPWRGLAVVALVALPWYVAELAVEGRPFWDSFFGYHNLQRFTQVVNRHGGPWWFYGPVFLGICAPFSPLALHGFCAGLMPRPQPLGLADRRASSGLQRFAACWALAVLVFFSLAATKLPSYALPASPALALLVVLAAAELRPGRGWAVRVAAWISLALTLGLGLTLLAAPTWVGLIQDPEMPGFAAALMASGLFHRGGMVLLVAASLGALLLAWRRWPWLLLAQLSLVAWTPLTLLPLTGLVDTARQRDVRLLGETITRTHRAGEPVAMVGIKKPSLHFYGRRQVRYEGKSPQALANLSFCMAWPGSEPTLLLVIDRGTAMADHWQGIRHQRLDARGLYLLWRLNRTDLDARSRQLLADGRVRQVCPVHGLESYN